jgi:fused signal recognition particle receptor
MLEDTLTTLRSYLREAVDYVAQNPQESVELVTLLVVLCLGLAALLSIRLRASQAEAERLKKELEASKLELVRAQEKALAVVPVEEAKVAEPELAPAGVETARESVPPVVEAHPAPEMKVEAVKLQEAPSESAISKGLKKSRVGLLERLGSFFSSKPVIDTKTLDDLEEALILSDVGAKCAAELVGEVKDKAAESKDGLSAAELKGLLVGGIRSRLVSTEGSREIYEPKKTPLIVLVVGVNGVGKTTTVAKLATKYMAQGKKVLAVAADTFRAAAVEQLGEWSSRVGFTLVRGAENAKPSAVVFDGMIAAKDGGFDVVLIDTAGRLHTKSNLMQELEGVRNSIRRHFPDGPHETVLVLDGVSGQNALAQAREFNQAVSLTGIVVTKLDGTPKGGIIVAISQELNLPVFFIGVGEKVEDLLRFDADAFVNALFDEDLGATSGSSDEVIRVSNA